MTSAIAVLFFLLSIFMLFLLLSIILFTVAFLLFAPRAKPAGLQKTEEKEPEKRDDV